MCTTQQALQLTFVFLAPFRFMFFMFLRSHCVQFRSMQKPNRHNQINRNQKNALCFLKINYQKYSFAYGIHQAVWGSWVVWNWKWRLAILFWRLCIAVNGRLRYQSMWPLLLWRQWCVFCYLYTYFSRNAFCFLNRKCKTSVSTYMQYANRIWQTSLNHGMLSCHILFIYYSSHAKIDGWQEWW